MYCNWSSFCPLLQNYQSNHRPVLASLPLSPEAAKDVTKMIVSCFGKNTSLKLNSEKEVDWCMEVVAFGLGLPLSENDTLRDCVNIYCDWLSTLLPQPKANIPLPLLTLPNHFSRKMLSHLYSLFIPRTGDSTPDMVNRQAVLCHRVLRMIQTLVLESSILDEETWDCLLLLLVAINNSLLAPPIISNDIGDQLCERIVSVLLEVWLQSCIKVYPTPRMWKTLTEVAQTWRHRKSLITLWNKVNLSLLMRLTIDLYGTTQNNVDNGNLMLIPSSLSGELLAQTWYRLLHFIGNPIQLAKRQVVGHKFLKNVIVPSQIGDPIQSCSAYLPNIFFEAMRGIAALVDTFLGIPTCHGCDGRSSVNLTQCSVSSSDSKAHLLPAPYRARCNSLLHLFGSWLFEAALLDCETLHISKVNAADRSRASSVSFTTESFASNRPRNEDPRDRPRSSTVVEVNESINVFPVDDYENGKAAAIGVLCKIFCSKKTEEDILPQYLARFYASLLHGLRLKEDKVCGFYVTSCIYEILMNSADLLRIDLDGVYIILPSLIDALEIVLTYKDVKLQPSMNRAELRRASIHVLISIISTPLHFHLLSLKEFPSCSPVERNSMATTFSHLRPRLTQIILTTLQLENDSVNTHLLLGALATYILDFASFEKSDHIPISSQEYISAHVQYDYSANVVSSSSDTHSCHSASSTSYPSYPGDNAIDQSSFNDKMPYNAPQSTCSLQGLVNSSIQLVSHKLLSLWKSDLNVSLAALEMLTSLSNIGIFNKMDEIRRVVRVLCDYITLQCSRPPPHHSKDLHSTIVAAFSCCASWLFSHPDLVADFDCLSAVLQVIELGISGSKSQVKGSDVLLKKHEKDLKPVSLRVRDAAELLLTCLVEEIGSVPISFSSQSVDENFLLRASGKETKSDLKLDTKPFRFFASEGTVYSILENSCQGFGQDSEPAITILLRNAYGRQLWTSQMRHLPRHKCGVRLHNNFNPGRPLPMNDLGIQSRFEMQNFPDVIDRVRPCLADKSIPHLDNVVVDTEDCSSSIELDELSRMVEASSADNFLVDSGKSSKTKVECSPPFFCTEFQTARLFLSHLGFLPFESRKDHSQGRIKNSLIGLDSSSSSFSEDLELLDRIERLTRDTVYVFYQRAGQKNISEIFSNTKLTPSLDSNFLEFLQTLGWPSEASNHYSFFTDKANFHDTPTTGGLEKPSTPSFGGRQNEKDHEEIKANNEHNPINRNTQILFWADGFSEIVFIWPDSIYWKSTPSLMIPNRSPQQKFVDRKPLNVEDADSNTQRTDKRSNKQLCAELNMIIVWLESLEDLNCFPMRELVTNATTSSDEHVRSDEAVAAECFIVFIHPLKSGLYRIHLRGPTSRIHCATPLVDGIVISRRVLGPLVRQTALNMAKRRRLDHDSYQLPHVQRKIKIAEMISRYTSSVDTPSFYSDLFVSSE